MDHLAGVCYELVDMPSKGFVFQLFGSTVHSLARLVILSQIRFIKLVLETMAGAMYTSMYKAHCHGMKVL